MVGAEAIYDDDVEGKGRGWLGGDEEQENRFGTTDFPSAVTSGKSAMTALRLCLVGFSWTRSCNTAYFTKNMKIISTVIVSR